MADLGVTSASSGYQSQTDKLVEAYKQSRQSEVSTLDTKSSTLQRTKSFFNGLYSKINNLNSAIDTFTSENASDKFVTRQVSNTNTDILSVSADSDAILGLNTVFVNHLASNDILVSDRFDLSSEDNSFVSIPKKSNGNAYGLSKKDYTFDISVGNNDPVSITIDLTGDETNEETLTKIVNAINNTSDIGVNASLIKDTETTARLSLVATETGSNNRISFSESKAGILNALGFDNSLKTSDSNRQLFDETHAGYKTANFSSLDSKFELNGIPITRGSNIIDDSIPGLTLTLLKPQTSTDQEVILNTEVDRKQVEDLIQPLLTEYNNALLYLSQDKNLLRSDTSISGLFSTLRNIISEKIPKDKEGDLSYLTEIGISIQSNGTLAIGDTEKLQDYLETDPEKVAHLFTSENGFANKISNAIENMSGDSGLIKARTLSLGDQIDHTNSRKDTLVERIDSEAESLRKQYTDMLKVYLEAQNQFNFLNSMPISNDSNSSLLFNAYK